jgi:hypothetical protein
VSKEINLSSPKLRFFDHENVETPDAIKPALNLSTANAQEHLKHRKQQQIKALQRHTIDCGSSAVQIAVMTERIHSLAQHLAINKKDHSCRRGLVVRDYHFCFV